MEYKINEQHRNGGYAFQKSQWLISEQQEQSCFNGAIINNWLARDSYWGLHLINDKPSKLGLSPRPNSFSLHIARFVGDQDIWHGYPVAFWMSPFDKPGESILKDWLNSGYINAPTMSKIARGKKCDL